MDIVSLIVSLVSGVAGGNAAGAVLTLVVGVIKTMLASK